MVWPNQICLVLTTALFAPLQSAIAAPQADDSTSVSISETRSSSASATSIPPTTSTIATATPSPSAGPTATLPSQVAVPPKQTWCPSEIFCPGPLLQTLHLANLFTDPKVVADKPTSKPPQEVLADFAKLANSSSLTLGDIAKFNADDFDGEGLELIPQPLPSFKDDPAFLDNVTDPLVHGFAKEVHGFWPDLIRGTNKSVLCDGVKCASSLIPLNHTFVVPGGRFREQYYWDSFWIVEGLLVSELYDIANSTLQNFMDELEHIGFIPNGGRIYYLDRSQPPLFTQILSRYVDVTNDTSILKRAVPLAMKELDWFKTNRSINITSPSDSSKTHLMFRYNVDNSAPRPESYLQDYLTANPDGKEVLTEQQRSDLYAELASGAESGWDYTARWTAPGNSNLTTLRIRDTIPICLNSILYKNQVLLADLVNDKKVSGQLKSDAEKLKAGILDLFWNPTKLAFYDFSISNKAQNTFFSVANFYPLWSGIVPPEVAASSSNAFAHFSSVNLVMRKYNGTYPSSFVETHQQWDAPNAWPPHNYIVLAALANLPSNVSSSALPLPSSGQTSFSLIPSGQLGAEESQLPGQPISPGTNSTTDGSVIKGSGNGTDVTNGGNSTSGEGWAQILERQLANRYVTSSLCSWQATGGSIDGLLPRLSDEELNVTGSINNTGNMFEKFSASDVNSAGRGGEYTVQTGFGWTNGVLLWISQRYGDMLAAPVCPNILLQTGNGTASGGQGGASGGNSGSDSSGGASQPSAATTGKPNKSHFHFVFIITVVSAAHFWGGLFV